MRFRHHNAEYHAKLVRQYAEARRLLTTLERETLALRQPGVKPDEVAARVADAVLGVQLLGQAGFVDAQEVVGELSKDLYERLENPGGIFGVPMGFREIDERIGGKREGELTIIAGVPGSGKTALGFQVALHNAVERTDRNAVAFVSAEMPKKDLFERGVCNLARLETHRVRRMMIQDEEITRLGRALETLKHAPLYTDDTPTPNVADVLARCRSLKMRHPEIKLIVVDFLQLLGGLDDENRAEELRAVSYALKGMAKLLKVHVIALAQLNDKVVEARSDKRPQLGDLQGSSGMRQAADWIALCYRPKMYDPALAEDIVEVNYAKCRGVATFTTDLHAQLQFMRLTDKPTPAGVIARAEWVHA
jgi:replicative DNA helicase